MSSQAVPRECAQKALDELTEQVQSDAKSKEAPFEYLRDTATTDEIKRQWFSVGPSEIIETTTDIQPKSDSNRQRAAIKYDVKESTINLANILRAAPIRYLSMMDKPGHIERPFPETILVIIALSPLTHGNGLPHHPFVLPASLGQGQDLILSGDMKQTFDGQGGGIAYLIVLGLIRQ